MGGVTLHIDYNDQQIQRVLTRLIETGQNPAPIMKDIAAYGENSTRDRFNNGVAPDGTPWKPLKGGLFGNIPKKHRRKDGKLRATPQAFNFVQGRKILIKQSHLLDSITNNAGNDFAEWGSDTSVTYAAIHQFGGKAGRGRKTEIPARPYLGINDQDEDNILDLIVSNINESISI